MKTPRAFDIFGNIALVKFDRKTSIKNKKLFANKILKDNKSIKTVLEKTQKFKGRLRKQQTKYLAGEKTKEALYRENNCVFRFHVDKTYFSPRLSNERKEISQQIKKNDEVLVMFAGVSPYPIVIAKISKAKKIYSNEINREANKYAKLNIELNKLKKRVELLSGDIKSMALKLKKKRKKFDVIVMPRPQLKETFLKEAFSLSKNNTKIYYYDFCKEDGIDSIVEKVKVEAKKARKKIKILKVKKAGEIAPYRYRIRIDFKVL
jgi:tRNA (guanine37-N1)-methyltransferase